MISLLLLAALAIAPTQTTTQETFEQGAPSTPADYRVGPGDMLSIRVYGETDFDVTARVSNSGRIHVPYVGVIRLAGMTPIEIESAVARMIRDQQLIIEPAVRVSVEQQRARPTYIIGSVQAPGQFMIMGHMYLLDLISKAGGLLPSAGDTAVIYRRRQLQPSVEIDFVFDPPTDVEPFLPADPTTLTLQDSDFGNAGSPGTSIDGEIITVDLDELMEGTQPASNIALQGGDIVYVQSSIRESFFVIGDVHVPGPYGMPRNGKVTASQAIIYAGGLLPTASSDSAFLMRHDADGIRQSVPIDFSAILDGKAADFPIQANDIIFVPSSAVRTVGVGLLNLVPTLLRQFLIF